MKRHIDVINPKCNSCVLYQGDKHIVHGEGQFLSPDLFIIGNAPDGPDHYNNTPFFSKSGQILRMTLNEIMKATGEDFTYYLTNTVQCRPPDDRQPSMGEIVNCFDRLTSEIQISNPKGILLLGSVASEALLNEKVTACRGKYRDYRGIPIIVTWDPKYILCNQGQFKTFADDIQHLLRISKQKKNDWSSPRKYTLITDVEEAKQFLSGISSWKLPVSIDLETTDLDPYKGFILRLGFHGKYSNGDFYTIQILWEIFVHIKDHLSPLTPITVYDSRMEFKWFYRHAGIEFLDINDPLLKAHCLDERTKQVSKSLKTIGMELCNVHDWSIPVKSYINNMRNCPEDIMGQYLSYDVEVAADVDEKLEEMLLADTEVATELGVTKTVRDAYYEVIKPAIPFVRKLTARGVLLDLDYLEDLQEKWTDKLKLTNEKIRELTGISDFNASSPQQVSKHLFETLKFPVLEVSEKTKQPTTSEKVITELALTHDDPFLDLLLDYRGEQKILSTYLTGLINKCSPDGRIHFDYYLEGTSTGRLSSDGQQIPRPTPEINIRKAFLPNDDCDFFDADYSQLEVVMAAHLAGDSTLISFINSGRDIYCEIGTIVFKRSIVKGTKERQFVKNMVLAVIYNSSIDGLVYNFKKDFPFLTYQLAESTIKLIREMFPDVYFRSLQIQKFVLENNYIQSIFGRKRRFPLIDRFNRNDVLKEGPNHPPQSAGSDVCLLAGVRIDNELKGPVCQMINHDSLCGSIPKGYDTSKIVELMEDVPFIHEVNFKVKVSVTSRWGEGE